MRALRKPTLHRSFCICLDVLKYKVGKKNEQAAPIVLHTDQGAVYSSTAYQMTHAHYNHKSVNITHRDANEQSDHGSAQRMDQARALP